jgi:hypothetical protein
MIENVNDLVRLHDRLSIDLYHVLSHTPELLLGTGIALSKVTDKMAADVIMDSDALDYFFDADPHCGKPEEGDVVALTSEEELYVIILDMNGKWSMLSLQDMSTVRIHEYKRDWDRYVIFGHIPIGGEDGPAEKS